MKSFAEELSTVVTIPKKTETNGARVATKKNDPVAKDTKSVQCINYQFGHYKSECQNPKAIEICFKCNKAGQLSRNRPQTIKRDTKPANVSVQVLRRVKQHLSFVDVIMDRQKLTFARHGHCYTNSQWYHCQEKCQITGREIGTGLLRDLPNACGTRSIRRASESSC